MRTDTPKKDSCWRHRNGNTYVVVTIANEASDDQERYPVTVVYQGANLRIWARRADDWHRSMVEISAEELR